MYFDFCFLIFSLFLFLFFIRFVKYTMPMTIIIVYDYIVSKWMYFIYFHIIWICLIILQSVRDHRQYIRLLFNLRMRLKWKKTKEKTTNECKSIFPSDFTRKFKIYCQFKTSIDYKQFEGCALNIIRFHLIS